MLCYSILDWGLNKQNCIPKTKGFLIFSNIQENFKKGIVTQHSVWELKHTHIRNFANFKAKQFRKIIPTYYSNIYKLPKFGILGPKHSHFTGRAAPGKTEEESVSAATAKASVSTSFLPVQYFFHFSVNSLGPQGPHWYARLPKAMEWLLSLRT